MLPLRVVFLWHYHQPDYRWEGRALLPWVRLRGVKDYATVFGVLRELGEVRCVLNLVPSLLAQLTEYATAGLTDPAETIGNGDETARRYWQMLEPPAPLRERFPVLQQLWTRLQEGSLTAGEWLDLQMWTQLVWTFPHRRRLSLLEQWFQQDRGFRAEELQMLQSLHRMFLRDALRALQELVKREGIELSCSPYYHPILPLLCDTDSAAESNPGITVPRLAFRFPQDAWLQCVRARQYCAELLGVIPEGMWAPEGAVSMAALTQMAAAGLRWTATDEVQLFRSLPTAPLLQKYLPHRVSTPAGDIVVFFRDRFLSDAIGFRYGGWEAERAVQESCQYMLSVREELVRYYGEAILQTAVLVVALDGENCWDSYPDNGVEFLHALSECFRSEPRLAMATCRDVLAGDRGAFPRLSSIRPGSWVEGSLHIWIGTPAHTAAWEALARARSLVEEARAWLPWPSWHEAFEHLLVAEGSDWFWWQSPEHPTPAAPLFEQLFQWHVERALHIARAPGEAALRMGQSA